MGIMDRFLEFLFGSGGGVKETVEIFRENAEAGAERRHDLTKSVLAQFAREFENAGPSQFDRVINGINRLPRPAMAFGTLALFVSAMVDPLWFADRMAGMALVPEPLWWLLGAIVSFYFGARHQAKSQEFQNSLTQTYLRAQSLRAKGAAPGIKGTPSKTVAGDQSDNPALEDWRRHQ